MPVLKGLSLQIDAHERVAPSRCCRRLDHTVCGSVGASNSSESRRATLVSRQEEDPARPAGRANGRVTIWGHLPTHAVKEPRRWARQTAWRRRRAGPSGNMLEALNRSPAPLGAWLPLRELLTHDQAVVSTGVKLNSGQGGTHDPRSSLLHSIQPT